MINIYCLKTFENYYKINSECQKKDVEPVNKWTVQKINADGKRCILFMHHTTAVYFTIFGFEREDLKNIKSLFINGLITEMQTHIKISESEKIKIKEYFKDFCLLEASTNKDVNSLVNLVVSNIKGLDLLNYGNNNPDTIEELYNQFERYFDKNNCKKLKDLLLK